MLPSVVFFCVCTCACLLQNNCQLDKEVESSSGKKAVLRFFCQKGQRDAGTSNFCNFC